MNKRPIYTFRYRPGSAPPFRTPTPEEIEAARRERERQKAGLAEWMSRAGKETVTR